MTKMSWRSVIISQHAKLSYSCGLMQVQTVDGISEVPISDITLLLVATNQAVITTGLISALSENNIKIIFVDRRHQPVSEINNYQYAARDCEKIMTQTHWNQKQKDLLWTKIIYAKIKNQIAVLKNYQIDSQELSDELDKLEVGDITNREAISAQRYFPLLFKNFEGRRKANVVNDALNYGYSILLSEVDRAIVQYGFLTEIGIHHRSVSNHFNLGSDLMEPFRPVIDYWVADHDFIELSPVVKINLVDSVNLEVIFNGKRMNVRNAILTHVENSLKFLSGYTKTVDIEMEFTDEVPDHALNCHV